MSKDPDLLSGAKAAEYLNTSASFLKHSMEIPHVEIPYGASKKHILYHKTELDKWVSKRRSRTELLDIDDYAKCFDFALAMYYRRYTQVDWSTARKREAGQSITDWVRGQLGELAVQKFLKKSFNVEAELDFAMYDEIVPQDIIGIKEGKKVRQPKLKVGIKATKFRNSYLVLGEADVDPDDRRSDIYILTRIDLPDDHLIRIAKKELQEILKSQQYYESYKDKMLDFEPVPCEVVGFIPVGDLEKVDDTARLSEILGTRNPKGHRYIKASGLLQNSQSDWKDLVSKL